MGLTITHATSPYGRLELHAGEHHITSDVHLVGSRGLRFSSWELLCKPGFDFSTITKTKGRCSGFLLGRARGASSTAAREDRKENISSSGQQRQYGVSTKVETGAHFHQQKRNEMTETCFICRASDELLKNRLCRTCFLFWSEWLDELLSGRMLTAAVDNVLRKKVLAEANTPSPHAVEDINARLAAVKLFVNDVTIIEELPCTTAEIQSHTPP